MENKNSFELKLVLKYGAILGFALILYTVLLHTIGQTMNNSLGYINYLIMLAVIIIAIKDTRDNKMGGFIEYGKGVQIGFLISLISGLIIAAFSVLLIKYIDPSLEEEIVNKGLEEALKKGTPESSMAQVESMTRFFFKPVMLFIMSLIGMVVVGVLESLVVAAIFKKKKDAFADAMKEVE